MTGSLPFLVFPSTFDPAGAGHDHVLHILGRISTLASSIMYFWNFSSMRIGIDPNVFASYLHGYAALGPTQVFMDTGRCSSLAHYCLFICKDVVGGSCILFYR